MDFAPLPLCAAVDFWRCECRGEGYRKIWARLFHWKYSDLKRSIRPW